MNGITRKYTTNKNFKLIRKIIIPETPDWLPDDPIYNAPKTWEIYLAYIPPMEKNGHQTYGIRPFIVNSNDICNKTSTEISGYVLTTKRPRLPVHVQLFPDGRNGLTSPSTIVMEQPRTIPKKFLIKLMGKVENNADKNKIRRALLKQDGFLVE